MATIGKWGEIKFSVNTKKQLTFNSMKRTSSATWKTKEVKKKRPKVKFQHPDMDEVTMNIILSAEMGVKPRTTLNKIHSACIKGKKNYLYVNGKKVCKNKMAITKIQEDWKQLWNKGQLSKATASVTFSEVR